jgi:hypothetical protein
MPAPERQYLASQSCGGWNAATRLGGFVAANGAAGLLRQWGWQVSGAIACSGGLGGMTPP